MHEVDVRLPVVHEVAGDVALVASVCALVTSETVIGGVTCGAIALAASGVTAATGGALYAEGKESGTGLALDVVGLGLAGVGSLADLGAEAAARLAASAAEGTSRLARSWADLLASLATAARLYSRAMAAEGLAVSAYADICDS